MKRILVVLMVGGILSCSGNQSQDKFNLAGQNEFNLAGFDSQRAAWEALGIDAYRFTGRSYPSYMFTIPVTVTVLPGKEPEFTYDEEKIGRTHLNSISKGNPFPPLYGSTIDELFDSIREFALAKSQEGYTLKILYNRKYHYPESFYWTLSGFGHGGSGPFEITFFEVLDGGE